MRRSFAATLLATVLLTTSVADGLELEVAGEPLRLDVTESLYLNWHGDPGNGNPSWADYGELINRLNLQASLRRWRLAVRVDSALFADVPIVGERLAKANCPTCIGTVREADLRDRFVQRPFDPRKGVEKVTLGYQGRDLELTLGDFYVQLGRGLVLSVRKVDELGIDTTLLGARVSGRLGPVSATAFAGLSNVQNVDEASATHIPDADDLIGGGRIEGRLFDKVLVGAHAAAGLPSRNRSTLAVEDDRMLRYGVSADAPRLTDWLGLYVEAARQDDRVSDAAVTGTALYAAATVYAGDVTFLLEGKDYRHYLPWLATNDRFGTLAYQQPPTLERVQTQLTTNSDVTAARLRADWRVSPRLLAWASAEAGLLSPARGIEHALVDGYAGAQVRWGAGRSHAFLLTGYRQETDLADGHAAERLVPFEWDLAQSLTGSWSVESAGLVWLRRKGHESVAGSGDNGWTEGNVYLALKRAPWVTLSAGYEFTTLSRESLNRHHFFNAAAQWNVRSDTTLRLFAGGQRPGLRCISGLCRVFPAFSGVRLEVVLRR